MKSSKLIIFYYNDIFAIIYYFERNDRIQKKKRYNITLFNFIYRAKIIRFSKFIERKIVFANLF